jgi:transcriptional regulator with XRE-family HTH domain
MDHKNPIEQFADKMRALSRPHLKLGALLVQLRKPQGWTREQVAKAAGVPLGTLRDYEQGRRMPSLENAARLAVALGVPLGKLAAATDTANAVALNTPRPEPKVTRLIVTNPPTPQQEPKVTRLIVTNPRSPKNASIVIKPRIVDP